MAALQKLLPQQDVVYLADRASFPYGGKSRGDLLEVMVRTLRFLAGFDPAAILVASNAPSITVLEALDGKVSAPLFGVRPPIKAALAQAGGGQVAVLGVKSLVDSPEMADFVLREAGDRAARVQLINASPLVELVESGAFLFDPDYVQQVVDAFVKELDTRDGDIGAITLSSTHLPWLQQFLERAVGGRPLLDPLDDVLRQVVPLTVPGRGQVLGLITEDERYSVADFRAMLGRLNVDLALNVVTIARA